MQMLFDISVHSACVSVILLVQFYYICLRMKMLKGWIIQLVDYPSLVSFFPFSTVF